MIFKIITTAIDVFWIIALVFSYIENRNKIVHGAEVFYYMLFSTMLLNIIEICKY